MEIHRIITQRIAIVARRGARIASAVILDTARLTTQPTLSETAHAPPRPEPGQLPARSRGQFSVLLNSQTSLVDVRRMESTILELGVVEKRLMGLYRRYGRFGLTALSTVFSVLTSVALTVSISLFVYDEFVFVELEPTARRCILPR